MNAAVAKPGASTILLSALTALPLLMPGARRRYGTIPVVIGVFGLGRQLYSWMRARQRRPAHEVGMSRQDPDTIAASSTPTHQ